jgi:hypothetical protein
VPLKKNTLQTVQNLAQMLWEKELRAAKNRAKTVQNLAVL